MHLQTRQWLERQFDIQIGGMRPCGGLDNRRVPGEPSVLFRTLHHVVGYETEGEIESRCIDAVGPALPHEARFGSEARQGHGVGLTIGDLQAAEHRTYIREHIPCYLCRRALVGVLRGDGDGSVGAVRLRRDGRFRVAGGTDGDRYLLARGVGDGDIEVLAVETVGQFDRLAFLQRHVLGVGLGLEGTLTTPSAAVTLGHGLPVLGFAVPGLKIDTSVHLPALQTADGVTEVDTGGRGGGAGPVVGSVI